MASIKDRGTCYQITVSLGRNSDGTKRIACTSFYPTATTPAARKKEVEAYAYEFEARVKNGEYYSGEKMTLEEFVPIWFSQCAEKTVTLRVREEYLAKLNRYFMPEIGRMKLSEIRTIQIQKIFVNMEKLGLSIKTIRNAFTPINSVMTFAFKQGIIKENPCLRCTLPRINPDKIVDEDREEPLRFFTVEQTNCFLGFLDEGYDIFCPERRREKKDGKEEVLPPYTYHQDIAPQFIAYFYVAIFGGFRLGEMCALKWKDIDFENCTVSIQRAVTKTKAKGQYVKSPKTPSSIRRITLPMVCFERLRVCKEVQKERMEELGSLWIGERSDKYDDNFVFIKWSNGSRIDIDTPGDKFERLIEIYNSNHEDKLPRIRLHDLRHTSATLLLAEGVNIETVSKRLGHNKTSTTLDIYGHAMPVKDADAATLLGKLISAPQKKDMPTE